jgi:hypothetical protein
VVIEVDCDVVVEVDCDVFLDVDSILFVCDNVSVVAVEVDSISSVCNDGSDVVIEDDPISPVMVDKYGSVDSLSVVTDAFDVPNTRVSDDSAWDVFGGSGEEIIFEDW